jgi:hypothetical protein
MNWITPREAAEILGISRHQLRELRRTGFLTARRFDADGQPCPHDELLYTCRCDFDADPSSWGECQHFADPSSCYCRLMYDGDNVHVIGYIGTVR